MISNSWDGDELKWSVSALQTMSSAFQQAAEAGITFLATSGDQSTDTFFANDGRAHVEYPASDPFDNYLRRYSDLQYQLVKFYHRQFFR